MGHVKGGGGTTQIMGNVLGAATALPFTANDGHHPFYNSLPHHGLPFHFGPKSLRCICSVYE